MGLTASIAFAAFGTATSAAGQIKAGNAAYRTAQVNAANIEDTSEINAQLTEKTAETNAGILDFNAQVSEANARDAIRRGFETEGRFGLQVRGVIGAQRAGYASQGIDVDTGSAAEVQADTAYQGHLDAITLNVDAAREAWGYKVEAASTRKQKEALLENARLEAESTRKIGRSDALTQRLGGNNARTASRYGAASTILGGAANVASQAVAYKRSTK